MKKILILLILFTCNFLYSQTNGFDFKFDGNTAKYDLETNIGIFSGKSAGTFELKSYMNVSDIDTALWSYVQNTENAKYSFVTNRATYGGLTAGKIKIPVVDLIGSTSFNATTLDTTKIFFNDQNNSVTGRNIFSDKQSFTDTLDVNNLTGDSANMNYGNFTTLKVNGVAVTPTDTGLLVHKTSFSQSIEASGGDFSIIAPEGNIILLSSNGNITFQDQDGFKYAVPPFGTPTSSAVTPATMRTVSIEINGIGYDFYIAVP